MQEVSTMYDCRRFFIDGEWVDPVIPNEVPVINPANREPVGVVSLGTAADVDRAVQAARRAFSTFSETSADQRRELLGRISEAYKERYEEIAQAIAAEMGSPITLARELQAATGVVHIEAYSSILKEYAFERDEGSTRIRKEPIGVCGLITPWNWPINQVACKVIPALAAGCTMVLKPSELTPVAAGIFAEVLDAAGLPAGVFNLVNGDGPTVGQALCAHPGVDMVSFTGSTRAGKAIAQTAATTVKRVAQELGGKSPNILLPDADFQTAVASGILNVVLNCGQSCAAPTRMLVPRDRLEEVEAIARVCADAVVIGDPLREDVTLGPLAGEAQFEKVQGLIQRGIDEGAKVVCGGLGKPDGLEAGFYVKPTVFSSVNNDMTIAREEIFGPVLVVMTYEDEDDAVRIANDTDYGLSSYVTSENLDSARRVARRIRAGSVFINSPDLDPMAPFGGYKQSGNGREWGIHGLEEYLETKAMLGFNPSTVGQPGAVKLT
jgi:aldehyde dehydrogenase (NAD+)